MKNCQEKFRPHPDPSFRESNPSTAHALRKFTTKKKILKSGGCTRVLRLLREDEKWLSISNS
jgi:hypothetical protein